MKELILLFLALASIGCCYEPDLRESNLFGNVEKTTEYLISIKSDSLNSQQGDTIKITTKLFKEKNLISKRSDSMLSIGENMNITFEYDDCGKTKKEIVSISGISNPTIVDYHYNKSLLDRTISESTDDRYSFRQLGKYFYDSSGKISESCLSTIFIDLSTGDTVKKLDEIDRYDVEGKIVESSQIDHIKPANNNRHEYSYREQRLYSTRVFDRTDSIVSIGYVEYENDSENNWITKKVFENGNLRRILIREIEYR
jgi:hypothetical protein